MNARSLLMLLLALPAGCGPGERLAPASAVDTVVADLPFTDSAFAVWIRGNDGPTPGDVLVAGQRSRLVAWTVVSGRTKGARAGGARDVDAARLRWRSLAPDVIAVDSAGRVHALRPGAGFVEAAAYLPGSPAPIAVDSMPFRVLAADPFASAPRFAEVSTAHSADAQQTCGITAEGGVACLLPLPLVQQFSDAGNAGPRALAAPAGARFHGVATGAWHVCALDAGGRAFCWGANAWGELGNGSERDTAGAQPVATVERFTRLSAGRSHTCGVTAAGEVLCWGLGLQGSRAPGADRCTIRVERRPHRPEPMATPCARTPRRVPLPGPARDVAAGDDHTCALGTDGEMYCWGGVYDNGFDSPAPRRIGPPGTRLVQLASGSRHVCGLDDGGTVYCWGRNWMGQLGAASGKEGSRRLARVPGVSPLRHVTAGDEHTCGIARSGDAAFCWGNAGDGQLGGGTVDEAGVTRVAGGLEWASLAAGHGHTCGVTSAGALYCWGSGLAFRREPGNFHEQPEPFAVSGWR
jgi:alpha-tubulin suppressor-like RCC1 family protein